MFDNFWTWRNKNHDDWMTMTSIIIGSRLLITTEPNLSSKNTPTQCSGRFQKYVGLMSGSQCGGDMSAKLVEKLRSMIDANSDVISQSVTNIRDNVKMQKTEVPSEGLKPCHTSSPVLATWSSIPPGQFGRWSNLPKFKALHDIPSTTSR